MLGEQHSAPLPHEWLSSYGFQVRGFSDGLLPLMFANISILGKTLEEKSSFPFINSQIYSFKPTSIKTYSNPVRHFALFCCCFFFAFVAIWSQIHHPCVCSFPAHINLISRAVALLGVPVDVLPEAHFCTTDFTRVLFHVDLCKRVILMISKLARRRMSRISRNASPNELWLSCPVDWEHLNFSNQKTDSRAHGEAMLSFRLAR